MQHAAIVVGDAVLEQVVSVCVLVEGREEGIADVRPVQLHVAVAVGPGKRRITAKNIVHIKRNLQPTGILTSSN